MAKIEDLMKHPFATDMNSDMNTPGYDEWVREVVNQGYDEHKQDQFPGKWGGHDLRKLQWHSHPETGNPHHYEVSEATGHDMPYCGYHEFDDDDWKFEAKVADHSVTIQHGTIGGEDSEFRDIWPSGRGGKAVIYDPTAKTLYVSAEGGHHYDLVNEFGIRKRMPDDDPVNWTSDYQDEIRDEEGLEYGHIHPNLVVEQPDRGDGLSIWGDNIVKHPEAVEALRSLGIKRFPSAPSGGWDFESSASAV